MLNDTLAGRQFHDQIGLDWSDTAEVPTAFTDAAGKQIFRKKIDFGALPNATTKNVAHGISNLNVAKDAHFRITGTVSDATDVQDIGVYFAATAGFTVFKVNATNVVATSTGDLSGVNAVVFLEYTKTA